MIVYGGFVHLHVHSYYSFFDSALAPRQIVEFAKSQGMTHIALTDTNSFTGIMEFNLLCREAGIKAVLGVEMRQPLDVHRKMLAKRAWKFHADDADVELLTEHAPETVHSHLKSSASPMLWHGNKKMRCVLLARNMDGYRSISHLLTRRHLEATFDLLKEVALLPKSVILISDCVEVIEAARNGACESYGELIPSLRLRRQNRNVYEYCRGKDLPLIMGGDVKLFSPNEKTVHHLLRAMALLTTVDNLPCEEKIDPQYYLMSANEVRDFFKLDRTLTDGLEDYQDQLETAYQNTLRVAESCECELPYRQWCFPKLELAGKEPAKLLGTLTWKGITWRYGQNPSEEVVKRVHHELKVIEDLGFTEYFLLVRHIIEEATERDYFTIGRGSAANSIVTYALGISNVCPVKYNLYFERFLNPDRSSPPDIDLDFSWRERDDMIDWCFEHFGRENVALISTISTLQYRQAVREVAKAFGIPPADVDQFNRLSETNHCVEEAGRLRDYTKEEPWITILRVAERISGFPHHLSVHCGGVVIAPFAVTDLMPLTLSAKGYAITHMDMLGVEDLGLVKMDLLGNRSLGVLKDALRMSKTNAGRIYEFVPDKPGLDSIDTAQREQVFQREATRMKLAGTRRGTSVALAGALHNLEGDQGDPTESYRRPLRERVLDFTHVTHDPWTRTLIDQGQTMGCFYIESPGMRALFERLRCTSYEEVVVASSIIRPGVAESGMMQEYIDRHQQTRLPVDTRSPLTLLPPANGSERMASGNLPLNAHSKTKPIHPEVRRNIQIAPTISDTMRNILPETHGVMVYQEDVLKVAHELAGMSFSEADILRRAISGKLRSTESMLKIQARFMDGCKIHGGLSEEEAGEVWRQLSSFAGYSFCKGHSAAFAVLSYQVAYLKAHHPAEFFAAVITNQGGFYGAGAYVEEARRWGIRTTYPCVNRSEIEYHGKTLSLKPVSGAMAAGVPANNGWIRPGFRFIGGLSARGMEVILSEREARGEFKDFNDFLERCGLSDNEFAALIRCGACDGFWQGQAPEKARAQALLKASLWKSQLALNKDTLFAMDEPKVAGFDVRPFTRFEICQMECEHLSYMISGHPLDFIKRPDSAVVAACEIRKHAGKSIRMIGWGIAAKVLSARNNRKPMKMLTLEDRTATYEAILFPRIYEKFAPRTLTRGPYLVAGEVDISLGSPTLNVKSIEVLKTDENGTIGDRENQLAAKLE